MNKIGISDVFRKARRASSRECEFMGAYVPSVGRRIRTWHFSDEMEAFSGENSHRDSGTCVA